MENSELLRNQSVLSYTGIFCYFLVLVAIIVIIHFLDKLICKKIKFLRNSVATRMMLYYLIVAPLLMFIFVQIVRVIKG